MHFLVQAWFRLLKSRNAWVSKDVLIKIIKKNGKKRKNQNLLRQFDKQSYYRAGNEKWTDFIKTPWTDPRKKYCIIKLPSDISWDIIWHSIIGIWSENQWTHWFFRFVHDFGSSQNHEYLSVINFERRKSHLLFEICRLSAFNSQCFLVEKE